MSHPAPNQPPRPNESGLEQRLALESLPPGRLAGLQQALRAAGLDLVGGQWRPGEVRLELAVGGRAVVATLGEKDPNRPAFVRSDRFDLGYLEGSGTAEHGAVAQRIVQRLGQLVDGAELARHLLGALQGRDSEEAQTELGDFLVLPSAELRTFAVQRCSKRPDVGPRQDGPAQVWLQEGEQYRVLRSERCPDDAAVAARVRGSGAGPDGRLLVLQEPCRTCVLRSECAGCWQLGDPWQETAEQLAAARAALGRTGPVEVLGEELLPLADTTGKGAPLLLISGADLGRRQTRLQLARRLRNGPRPAGVLVLGREPGLAVAGAKVPLRPASAARVARSLLGSALQLRQADWPHRGDDLHFRQGQWWLWTEVAQPGAPPPLRLEHVTLALNRRCVTVCRYCDLPLRLREDMPIARVFRVLEEVVALGGVSLELFGGEVTLRPDLIALLAHAKVLGLQTFVTTTGLGLSDKQLLDLARAGITDLSISIDSADPAVHDDLKGRPGMFDAAVRAASELKRLGAPHVGLNTVITPANFEVLPGVVRLSAQLGLAGVTMFLCQPVAEFGNATPLLDKAQSLKLIREILPEARRLGRELGVHVGVRPAIDTEGDTGIDEACSCSDATAARIADGEYSRIFDGSAPCRITEHLVSVRGDGSVRLCNQPVMQFDDSCSVGNVADASLVEILQSPRAAEFRQQAGTLPLCKYCTFDHSVAGANPGLATQVAGEGAADRRRSQP
ncbi:MAG: radical SAM protein [Deltaproteobacteria bacterium]|nr:radical SAM protein [Deltaproteobacteria bacterium]